MHFNEPGGWSENTNSDSLLRADPLLFLGVHPRLVHLLLFLVLLVVYTRGVWQWGRGRRRRAGGMGGPHPADDARLRRAVVGRGPGGGGLRRIDPVLLAALRGSGVALPYRRALQGVSLFLIFPVQVVVKGDDVGDFLFPPALFPQSGV